MITIKLDLFQKQKLMMSMFYPLLALLPLAVYFYGYRVLLVFAVVQLSGFFCEYLFNRVYKKKVTQAVLVSNTLFALSLPPTIPLWIAAVGIIFGILFAKLIFGGFGKNIFNPAIAGRAFIYTSFGYYMTSRFVQPVSGAFGGFAVWQPSLDTLTSATPLVLLRTSEQPFLSLLFGNTAGSIGETSALLILIIAAWLLIKKIASYRIALGALGGFLAFQTVFFLLGLEGVPAPHYALAGGSVLFGIMFMATDPVSSSQRTDAGRWVYGVLTGVLMSLIRSFSLWPEGTSFAILLANMFAPLLDMMMSSLAGVKGRKG